MTTATQTHETSNEKPVIVDAKAWERHKDKKTHKLARGVKIGSPAIMGALVKAGVDPRLAFAMTAGAYALAVYAQTNDRLDAEDKAHEEAGKKSPKRTFKRVFDTALKQSHPMALNGQKQDAGASQGRATPLLFGGVQWAGIA